MKPLTPEQLLIIADEFCAHHGGAIRSYSALCAAAAIPGARIEGIPVFDSPVAAGEALARGVVKLEPLRGDNSAFASTARDVYVRWAETIS
ncbi:TetR family transcriptional regulator [Corynebacterium sp. CCUG 71335]|uniref:TetR family transcriptional regulator n=1 Tax=unclassified Corynebacterium TaxID=2624378 RepID=UPI002109850E|nr:MULTISPECIES: TetR family transcriptional regulator [unclassified Corynebacterium]MCQ4620039.1 TetR family transcriptional regulator [Corynebacterium sp. CCUG 71335]MCQ4623002.1 TetR family transcriptional regulator [Corynebacterium sp. CCUG 70398]MCQ4624381.1 TetR family transcriptional regulator [Corynebacterium sp. CCUG 69979]MCQ4626905.1 TetR family transcriptional regulator [Corynebacterium sp. CCUG 65737]